MKDSAEIMHGVRLEWGPDVWKRGHDFTVVLVNELKQKRRVTAPESQTSRDTNG